MSEDEFESLLELQKLLVRNRSIRLAALAARLPPSTFYDRLKRLKKELEARENSQAKNEVDKSPVSVSMDEQKPLHIRQIEEYARENYEKYGIEILQGETSSPFTPEEWETIERGLRESKKHHGIT